MPSIGQSRGPHLSSLLLLIDGYNLIAPVAPPGRGGDDRWLERERMRLIDRLVQGIDEELHGRTCVVFDAANPPQDRPSEFQTAGVAVKFAVGYPEADDLLEELISANSSPKTLAVVSSDHRVQTAATRRGCRVYDSQPWLDEFLDGVVGLAGGRRRGGGVRQGELGQGRGVAAKPGDPGQVDDREVDRWLREFGF